MEATRSRLINHEHGERFIARTFDDEFKSGRHQDGNVFAKLCCIATRCNVAATTQNIVNLLLTQEPLRGGRRARSQSSIREEVGGTQDRALLRGSEVITANKNVAQHQRSMFRSWHRPLPVTDKQVNSTILWLSLPGIFHELWPGIRIDPVDGVL